MDVALRLGLLTPPQTPGQSSKVCTHQWKSNGALVTMSQILLVQPAFALAQELHHSFNRPKYVRRCHAPSCGKAFFTHRKSQVICESVPGGTATKCRVEWTNFSRYLKNLRKDPKKDWDHPVLKQQWLRERINSR
jgi:hypothetical protein